MYGILVIVFILIDGLSAQIESKLITREEWRARPPKAVEKFKGPSKFIIIHHSYIPAACYTTEHCKSSMRAMQVFHQDQQGWNDIGYSFAIGGDGFIYFGRGFNVVGAHAPGYNNKSVGICLIGDWRTKLPSAAMLQATKELIEFGISKGFIYKNYKLLGHRQVRSTECPGDRLFNEIKTWPRFSLSPDDDKQDENEVKID